MLVNFSEGFLDDDLYASKFDPLCLSNNKSTSKNFNTNHSHAYRQKMDLVKLKRGYKQIIILIFPTVFSYILKCKHLTIIQYMD